MAMTLPSGADKEGLLAAYNNAATAVNDKQAVTVIVVKDSGTLDQLKDAEQLRHRGQGEDPHPRNVAVVYAPAGNNNLEAVKKALNGL